MPQQMRDDLAAAASAMIGFDNPKSRCCLSHHPQPPRRRPRPRCSR
jgi:hypothetical protein